MPTKEKLRMFDLAHFTGDEQRYRTIIPNVIFTPGVQALADGAQAYWLVDAIASYYTPNSVLVKAMANDPRLRSMVFWKLRVTNDNKAVLNAVADSGEPPAVRQNIEYTDFLEHANFGNVDIWAEYDGKFWTLLLPTEH